MSEGSMRDDMKGNKCETEAVKNETMANNPAGRGGRPKFPKRAVITAGMPYGNKELHLGHIGGVFVHADAYARFLRDRIGNENVIFVSGTDCYGSPILEHYRKLVASGGFEGTIQDFVEMNHKKQMEVLDQYHISTNIFAGSGIGRAAGIHKEVSEKFIRRLYENGHIQKITTSQFYDPKYGVFLNGRQVVGHCPIAGCSSERGYADECSLGHQYMPSELLDPKSTLSGEKPEMRDVTNWYFMLDKFHGLVREWVDTFEKKPGTREFVVKSIKEFLEPPVVFIKRDQFEAFSAVSDKLPHHSMIDEERKSSFSLVFESLEDREKACGILSAGSVRYRTGKTLVPFRLTGNIEWGVPAPAIEDLEKLTIWVWPESLWAPISFTMTCLEQQGYRGDSWKNWWCSREAGVYQFIGEDNVYFYGPAEMSMFMGQQGMEPSSRPSEGQLQLPKLIVNNHLLFLDKKASSSGSVKPPMAAELLDYYTAEQLRAHFLGLGLGIKSVSFQPKPLNPKAGEKDSDPVLKEGNLLSNVFNRAVRSCFYTSQKYFGGRIPAVGVSPEITDESRKVILEYEILMSEFRFHQVMSLMDNYIRNMNKFWSTRSRQADESGNQQLRGQVLSDMFHMVRTAAVLMHPIAPEGTEMIREYLGFGEEFWCWDHIFDTVFDFMKEPGTHQLKLLEPRIDFFKKHPSQIPKTEDQPGNID